MSILKQIWRLLFNIHNIALKQKMGPKMHLFIIFYKNIYYKIFKGESQVSTALMRHLFVCETHTKQCLERNWYIQYIRPQGIALYSKVPFNRNNILLIWILGYVNS